MCNPGAAAKGYLNLPNLVDFVKHPTSGIAPKVPQYKFPKPPKLPTDPGKDIALAQQHAKEAAIGAYSYSDTVLTGGKGLGSTSPTNLWKQLGSSG